MKNKVYYKCIKDLYIDGKDVPEHRQGLIYPATMSNDGCSVDIPAFEGDAHSFTLDGFVLEEHFEHFDVSDGVEMVGRLRKDLFDAYKMNIELLGKLKRQLEK
jgi:hypothetical protein